MKLISWTKTALNTPAQALSLLLDENSNSKLFIIMLVFLAAYWLYVPIHELMHVAGCLLAGGEVQELAIDSIYGGNLLAKIFPFVVGESDYAGQLTGFTTPNKFAYFIVDIFPYLLSLPGVLFIRLAVKNNYLWLFSIGFLLMLVPFTQVFGDFYEAASLGMGELMAMINPNLNPALILSDDMFKLISTLSENAATNSLVYFFVALSFITGAVLAWLVIIIQVPLANIFQTNAEN